MPLTEKIYSFKNSRFKALWYTDKIYNVDELFASAIILSHQAGKLQVELNAKKNQIGIQQIPYQLQAVMTENASSHIFK